MLGINTAFVSGGGVLFLVLQRPLYMRRAGNSKDTISLGYADDQETWQDGFILHKRQERAALIQMRQCFSCLE